MFFKGLKFGLLIILVSILSGCFESKQHYTINPDGSGKVDFVVNYAYYEWLNINRKKPDVFIADLKKDATGVDAWKDLSYTINEDKTAVLTGTAFFKDINNLMFETEGLSTWLQVSYQNAGNGRGTIQLKNSPRDTSYASHLSEEEIQNLIKTYKEECEEISPYLDHPISDIRMVLNFAFSGQVTDYANFKQLETGGMQVVLDGKNGVEILKRFCLDDNWWRQQIKYGSGSITDNGPYLDEAMNEILAGAKAPIFFNLSGISTMPMFDYEKEVARYRDPEITDNLSMSKTQENSDSLKNIEIKTLKIITVQDIFPGLPFPDQNPGYIITMCGDFPGKIIGIEGGKVLTALTEKGQSLFPFDQNVVPLDEIVLSEDKSQVTFVVTLALPQPGTQVIKEISGELFGYTGGEIKRLDLGIPAFEPGIEGSLYDARVESLSSAALPEGENTLVIKVSLPPESIGNAYFFDEFGRALPVNLADKNRDGEATMLGFVAEEPLPLRGSVLMDVYLDQEKISIPFAIKDIDLIGRPIPK